MRRRKMSPPITEAYPRGYLVTKSFTFTLVAAGIHSPELDVRFAWFICERCGLADR